MLYASKLLSNITGGKFNITEGKFKVAAAN